MKWMLSSTDFFSFPEISSGSCDYSIKMQIWLYHRPNKMKKSCFLIRVGRTLYLSGSSHKYSKIICKMWPSPLFFFKFVCCNCSTRNIGSTHCIVIKLDECAPWCGNLLSLLPQKPLNWVWWVRTSTITFHTM